MTHNERDDRLIQVTMTRSAAERFKQALTAGESALVPSYEPPLTDREKALAEHADWLRWGCSRIFHAESIADAEAGPSVAAAPGEQS